ncbi:MAG: hypothetical protein EOS10_18080 [Mesorhizobium sp.]|uniref:hypothetical protein n=1 Tax=Mesorhizobium sp. TaxID=1871066 RepID=UPI000FE58D55|nr:hypothetical protein [Mesorhizobium sp.]RWO30427.1 MAG: hypothetical protein EOS10_18080 [Mesorhizobium sp.]
MQVIQNRRRFLAGMSAIGAVGLTGGRNSSAENALLDTTTVRFTHTPATCNAPLYLAEELLRADGFTGLTYVDVDAGVNTPMKMTNGEADFGFECVRHRNRCRHSNSLQQQRPTEGAAEWMRVQ